MKLPKISEKVIKTIPKTHMVKISGGGYPYNLKEENKQAKATYENM